MTSHDVGSVPAGSVPSATVPSGTASPGTVASGTVPSGTVASAEAASVAGTGSRADATPDVGSEIDGPQRAAREVASSRTGFTSPWALATVAVALGVLVLVLQLGGGAPQPPVPGLPDPGPITGWALPALRLASDLLAFGILGLTLTAALLLPARHGLLGRRALRGLRLAANLALAWVLVVAVQAWFAVSDLVATPSSELSRYAVTDYLRSTSPGRAVLVQIVVASLVAALARWVATTRAAAGLLVLAVIALVPPALTGHSASAGNHELAVASLMVHVVAAALWVGGLVALGYVAAGRDAGLARVALPRYSTLAAWCLASVAVSGLVNAGIRMPSVASVVTTSYGRIVLAKVTALAVLALFGWRHRQRTIRELSDASTRVSLRPFAALAAIEVTVMAATVALAVALGRTPTPAGDVLQTTRAAELLGYPLPAAPTTARLAFGWLPDGFALTFLALAAALYLTGMRVLWRRGDRWPIGRTAAWFGGLLVVAWATVGGLGLYSHVLFSAHMVAHMLLSMVAPIFLVLGAPVTLALRTLPGPRVPTETSPRELLLAVLHSRVVRVMTHPLVAFVIFVGSLYVVYFSSILPVLMEHHVGHVLMDAHFLAAGSLFFYVLVGVDPAPRRLPPLAQIGMLFAAMPFHAFFSVAVMQSTSVLAGDYFSALDRPYRTNLIGDQQLGGGIGWALGELPMIVVLFAVFIQWVQADEREWRRIDRAADRAGRRAAASNGVAPARRAAAASGSGVPERREPPQEVDPLDAYNAYLRALAERDRRLGG